MADKSVGDWIKMRTDLYRDPKVLFIAEHLHNPDSELSRYVNQNLECSMAVTRNVMRNVTVGALVTVWGVCRHQGKRSGDDLILEGAGLGVIDDLADLPGFGSAMESAGWVKQINKGLKFPKFFEKYNVDPSDSQREKARLRQRRLRERRRNARNVTVTLQRHEKVTVEPEPEREYKTLSPGSGGGVVRAAERAGLSADGSGRPLSAVFRNTGFPGLVELAAILAWYDSHHEKVQEVCGLPPSDETAVQLLSEAKRIHEDGRITKKVGCYVRNIEQQRWLYSDKIRDHVRAGIEKYRKSHPAPWQIRSEDNGRGSGINSEQSTR